MLSHSASTIVAGVPTLGLPPLKYPSALPSVVGGGAGGSAAVALSMR
jgi:hypothetical protein